MGTNDGKWALRLFGGFSLEDPEGRAATVPTRKACQLIALLALHPDESLSRDQAAGILWPDANLHEARNRLNVTLTRLRSALGDAPPFEADKAALRAPSDRFDCDLSEFRRLLQRSREVAEDRVRVHVLRDALLMADGEFLAGHDDPWVQRERRLLEREIVKASAHTVEIVNGIGDFVGATPRLLKLARSLPGNPDMERIVDLLDSRDGVVRDRLFLEENRRRITPPAPRLEDGRHRWDAAADFDNEHNPNGAWCFGWRWDLGQPFSPFRDRGRLLSPDGELFILRATAWHALCAFVNDRETNFGFNEYVIGPGQLVLHPGPHGQKAVVRWAAPRAGRFRVRAHFHAVSPDATTDVHVAVADVPVFSGNIEYGSTSVLWRGTVDLAAGATVEALVGPSDDGYDCDTTGLEFTINPV